MLGLLPGNRVGSTFGLWGGGRLEISGICMMCSKFCKCVLSHLLVLFRGGGLCFYIVGFVSILYSRNDVLIIAKDTSNQTRHQASGPTLA